MAHNSNKILAPLFDVGSVAHEESILVDGLSSNILFHLENNIIFSAIDKTDVVFSFIIQFGAIVLPLVFIVAKTALTQPEYPTTFIGFVLLL
jgi:hypothetical protein